VVRDWVRRRYQWLLREGLPDTLLAILVPTGLLGVARRRCVPLLLVLPLFVLLYSFYPFFLVHYVVIAAPTLVLLVLLGADCVASAGQRRSRVMVTMITLFIVGVTIISLPEFNRVASDSFFHSSVHPRVNDALARLEHKPAVVLFRYAPDQSLEEEPVYNAEVTWPDDAEIVRAHDLGARNVEIFRYYARRHPDRAFYHFDRADNSIRFLGFAKALASAYNPQN
jgi:hypothetical protein